MVRNQNKIFLGCTVSLQLALTFRLMIVLALFFVDLQLDAQQIDSRSDLELVGKKLSEKQKDPYRRPFMGINDTTGVKKVGPVKLIMGSALYVYQNVFSKQIASKCLFIPACSEFSKEAINRYGAFKGLFLSVDRVNRCSSFSRNDYKDHKINMISDHFPDSIGLYSGGR
jgi:putative membrane protein insertion efficiency factor